MIGGKDEEEDVGKDKEITHDKEEESKEEELRGGRR